MQNFCILYNFLGTENLEIHTNNLMKSKNFRNFNAFLMWMLKFSVKNHHFHEFLLENLKILVDIHVFISGILIKTGINVWVFIVDFNIADIYSCTHTENFQNFGSLNFYTNFENPGISYKLSDMVKLSVFNWFFWIFSIFQWRSWKMTYLLLIGPQIERQQWFVLG